MAALTPYEKFSWYDRVTFDTELSHISVRVAHAIGAGLNSKTGILFIKHITLAMKLGVSSRTIERAIAELEVRGHLRVTRPTGRGNANVYRPVIGDVDAEPTDNPAAENPTKPRQNPDNPVQKARHQSLSYPSFSLSKNITHKDSTASAPIEPASAPPPASGSTASGNEPAYVRHARLGAEDEERRTEQGLAERLTVAGEIDGHELLVSVNPRLSSVLSVKLRDSRLTADDIAAAHAEFRVLEARGLVIEIMPTPDNPGWCASAARRLAGDRN